MRMPLWEIGVLCVVVVAAKLGGEGFAHSLHQYECSLLGEFPADRRMRCPFSESTSSGGAKELIESWDEQIKAERFITVSNTRSRPVSTLLARIGSETL